jgi:hypothetical protein
MPESSILKSSYIALAGSITSLLFSVFAVATNVRQRMRRLEVIGKLVYNASCMPNEEKYKRVRTKNAKINALVIETPGVLEAMRVIGWQQEEEALTCTKPMAMSQVSARPFSYCR